MNYIDYYLNKITMYRLITYGLSAIAVIAIIFGFTETISFSGTALLAGLTAALLGGFVAQQLFTRMVSVAANHESSIITSLITFFLFLPPNTLRGGLIIALVSFLAVATKYIVVYKKKHIANPAALAAVLVGVTGLTHAAWWVGSSVLAVFIAILGFAILRKINRFTVFAIFVVTAASTVIFRDYQSAESITQLVYDVLISSPILFLGTIMLTEPSTMPPSKKIQALYAIIIGLLYGIPFGESSLTPEMALVIGNVFAYVVSPELRGKTLLKLIGKRKLGSDIYEYNLAPSRPLHYTAGQYIDVTIPVSKVDQRGNRRTFSIASSPTESSIIIATRHFKTSSAFKNVLVVLHDNARLDASNVAGNFTLPDDSNLPLVWIAGGIGVTPFRSMAQYVIDTKQEHNIVLLYQATSKEDFIYQEIFAAAEQFGITTVYISDGKKITQDTISRYIPDYADRRFYVSGPNGMVRSQKRVLESLKISQKSIVTDYFSGY